MARFAGNFVIKTLEGDLLEIELGARAAPHKPYTLDGTMRAEFTWYPGAATATIQMLGATEKNTTISGDWNDKFIKSVTEDGRNVAVSALALVDGVQADDVNFLVNVFQQLRLQGRLLEVSWEEQVRHGILLGFKTTWKTPQQLDWEMEFGWSSRGEAKQPIAKAKGLSFDDLQKAARKYADDNQKLLDAPPLSFQADIMGTLNSLNGQIFSALTDLEDQLTQFADDAVSPFETAQRTLAVVETVQNSAQTMVDTIASVPQRIMSSNSSSSSLDMGTDLQTDAYFRSIKNNSRAIVLSLAEQATTLREETNQTNVLGAFTAQQDTDLRTVSQHYYGTPNQWRNLRDYNNMTGSRLTAGQLVLVPRLNSTGPST